MYTTTQKLYKQIMGKLFASCTHLSPVSLTLVINLYIRIYSRIFGKNLNDSRVNISRIKSQMTNLMALLI
jgi:hypothetical protein